MVRAKSRSPFPWFGGNRKTTNIRGITSKSRHTVKYPDLPSAVRPIPHSEEYPVPKPAENLTFSDDISDSGDDH